MYFFMYLKTPQHERDLTRSVLKQNPTGFEFIFPSPRMVAAPRFKSPVFPYYLLITVWRIVGFVSFPRILVCYVKCKQPHPGFELGSPYPFPTMITIKQLIHTHTHTRTHTHTYIYIYIYIYICECVRVCVMAFTLVLLNRLCPNRLTASRMKSGQTRWAVMSTSHFWYSYIPYP